MRARPAENYCDKTLEISIKYISEYSSPCYAAFKKINTDKKIKKYNFGVTLLLLTTKKWFCIK